MQSQSSEILLVRRAIKRDREAFTALYDMHIDRVYNHIYYRVPLQVDAEDITQEVFLKAWKAIGKYKVTEAPFVAWLIAIAHNLIADYYKKREKRVSVEEIEAGDEDVENNLATTVEMNLDRARIREAILRLKGDKQKVILMHYVDGFSYEEIAAIMHKREGAIRVIKYRALSELKQMLGTE